MSHRGMTVVGRSSVWGSSGFVAGAWVLLVLVPTSSAVSHNPSVLFAHEVSVAQWVLALAFAGIAVLVGCAAIFAVGRRWVWHGNPGRAEPWVTAAMVAVPFWSLSDRLLGGVSAAFAALVAVGVVVATGFIAPRMKGVGLAVFTIALLTAVIGSAAILAPVATAGGRTPVIHADGSDDRPNVLWIILDEAGAGALMGPDGKVRDEFPALQALARTSTTYTRTYTTYPYTDIAIPAMMSGRTSVDDLAYESPLDVMYDEGFLPQLAQYFEMLVPQSDFFCRSYACWSGDMTVADRIRLLAGDATVVVASAALPAPIRTRLPSTDGRVRDFWADTPDMASTDLAPYLDHWEREDQRGLPFFAIVHSYAVHYPWNFDANGQTVMPLSADPFGVGSRFAECEASRAPCTPGLVELRRRQYVNGLREADREVGRQLADLSRRGLLDSTLVIVTADHGAAVALGQDSRRPDSIVDRVDVARVPLIVKSAGQSQPVVVSEPRSTGQIMPTVLAEAGFAADVPLVGLQQPAPDGSAYSYPLRGAAVGDVDGTNSLSALDEVPPAAWTPEDYLAGTSTAVDVPEAVARDWADAEATVYAADGTSDLAAVLVVTDDDRCRPADGVTGVLVRGGDVIATVEWESEVAPSGARRGWSLAPDARGAHLTIRCAGPAAPVGRGYAAARVSAARR